MKITTIAFIVLVFSPLVIYTQATGTAQSYVGFKYKVVTPDSTLPNGVKHVGGTLVGEIEADPVVGISQVEKGTIKMLWLEESTGRDGSRITGWKVVDVLSFPALSKTDNIFFVGDPVIECRRGGNYIYNLVGVGRIFRRQGIFKPSKLWVVNTETQKFEPLKLAGVTCEYSEP